MSEYGAYKRETKKLLRSYPKKMGRGGSKNKRYRNIKPRSVFFLGKTPEMKILDRGTHALSWTCFLLSPCEKCKNERKKAAIDSANIYGGDGITCGGHILIGEGARLFCVS